MKAGSTRKAWSILVSKASPMSTADTSRWRVRPVSTAFHSAQAPARHSRVSRASGLL